MCKTCCGVKNPVVLFHKGMTLEEKNAATEELNTKLRLESVLDRQLRPLMNRMNRDFRNTYAASGQIINFSRYTADMAAILRRSYDRAQRAFTGKVETKAIDDPLFDLGLAEWQAQRLETQPEAIINTTQRDADKAVRDAQQALIEENAEITATTVAISAAVINRRRLFGRITGISITETQAASESTKLIEAEVASGRVPFTVTQDPFAPTRPQEEAILPATKRWVTVGDRRVRDSHIQANGQTVEIDDSFSIGGFPMRHPGDLTKGAPLVEWINCRCASNINIDNF